MAEQSVKGDRDGDSGTEVGMADRFFDWERADPTQFAGSNGLTEELLTYKGRLSELLNREGAFVLIKGNEVIGVYNDPEEALAVALDRFKEQRVLIKQILAREPIHSTGGVEG